ncbi:hypothetical protein FF38_09272 [Lucilia cuprina]|uniref:Uncharacterized protein n=1 Tax=Lucilia cuprina TaxID=7375 RepID=A0A0L0CFB9_LUCCU|nr:hypothetical protein FF38_09272 [Lucilia cuprina]
MYLIVVDCWLAVTASAAVVVSISCRCGIQEGNKENTKIFKIKYSPQRSFFSALTAGVVAFCLPSSLVGWCDCRNHDDDDVLFQLFYFLWCCGCLVSCEHEAPTVLIFIPAVVNGHQKFKDKFYFTFYFQHCLNNHNTTCINFLKPITTFVTGHEI